MNRKCILIVSFGSVSYEVREKCIYSMEKRVRDFFPNLSVYGALSSGFILKKIRANGEKNVFSVKERMEEIIGSGYEEVLVQPSFVTDGVEYNRLIELLNEYKEKIKISLGKPILYSKIDFEKMAEIMIKESKNDCINVFMGHGAESYDGKAYLETQRVLSEKGYENIIIAAVEGVPSFEEKYQQIIKNEEIKKVHLQPLLIVAGEHAKSDMIGNDENSWKSRFEAKGFEVDYSLKGLGEMEEIAELLAEHIKALQK